MKVKLYNYKARVLRVLDGDTIEVIVNMGFAIAYDGGTKTEWTDEAFDRILNTKLL